MLRKRTLFLAVCLCYSVLAKSQTENKLEKKSYTTNSIGTLEAPKLDGILDDAAWGVVEWTSDYVQNEPDNGAAPTEQTKIKIVYDDKKLYIAAHCLDAEQIK